MTERQKEIVTISLDIIANEGIQGLTIKNLAKRIGISEPAIYRHYENKVQILVAILDYFKNNTELYFAKELQGDMHSVDKIEHFFRNNFKTFSENPSFVVVIFSEDIFRNEPMLLEKITEVRSNNKKMLLTIIKTGQQNGEIRADINATHFATIIMGTLKNFVNTWHQSGRTFNLINEGNELLKSIQLLITANS